MIDSVNLLAGNQAYGNAVKPQGLGVPLELPAIGGVQQSGTSAAGVFSELVGGAVSALQSGVGKGEQGIAKALVEQASLNEVVTAVNEAEITLKAVVAVRDKIISAYQDIIKMPI